MESRLGGLEREREGEVEATKILHEKEGKKREMTFAG